LPGPFICGVLPYQHPARTIRRAESSQGFVQRLLVKGPGCPRQTAAGWKGNTGPALGFTTRVTRCSNHRADRYVCISGY